MPAPADSRTAILDAAQRLFAAQGFAATTIKEIGTEAGVNSALLYYYFKDKETLYREMLRRIVETLVATGVKAFGGGAAPVDAIRGLVAAQSSFFAANPDVPRIIARELVDHEAAHASEHFANIAANLFRRLCDAIRDGQRSGRFRRDLDPQFAAISTISQVVYFNIARPAVDVLLGHGRGGVPDAVARAFGEHAADFAIAALSAPSPRSVSKARKRRIAASRDRSEKRK